MGFESGLNFVKDKVPLMDDHTEPALLFKDGIIYCYYRTDHSLAVMSSSDEGKTWTEHGVILSKSPQWWKWDSQEIIAPSVIYSHGKYILFYEAGSRAFIQLPRQIGMATADDPLGPFVKSKHNPILRPNILLGEGIVVGTPAVVEANGIYYMFYHSNNFLHDQTCVAYSRDLIKWNKEPRNPILKVEKNSWYSVHVAPTSVYIPRAGTFYIFVEGWDGLKFRCGVSKGMTMREDGMIYSETGWEIPSLSIQEEPVIDVGPLGSFDDGKAQRPGVIKMRETLICYYSGGNHGFHLGRAVAEVKD